MNKEDINTYLKMEKPMPLVHHKLPLIPFSYAFLTKKPMYKSHGVVRIMA
jgi:hypothetical protein